jgi:hypothetical protein
MFKLEKLISKPIIKWIMNSEKGDEYTKIIIEIFCFLHLLTVALLA